MLVVSHESLLLLIHEVSKFYGLLETSLVQLLEGFCLTVHFLLVVDQLFDDILIDLIVKNVNLSREVID